MTLSYVTLRNLARNPLRTGLTLLAFALPMCIFVAALSLVVALQRVAAETEKELRLAVRNKVSLTNLVPEGLRRRIEGLDKERGLERIVAVCGMRWFGGRVPDTQTTLTSLAADADTFPIVYSDVEMTPDEITLWNRERRAAVTGIAPAERFGWKAGDRVVLESTVPPYLQLDFILVKVLQDPAQGNVFYFRRDYLVESLTQNGASTVPAAPVNIFWVKCRDVESLRALQNEIDAMTANSSDETKSEDENAFVAGFTQALGDVPGLMQAMALVVVAIIALVAGNTMMMSFRERTRELATLKAIGFGSRRIFSIVLAESVLLALLGALLGVVPTAALLTAFPLRQLEFGPISALEISPTAVAGALLISVLVGVAAGLWPALQAMRLQTVDALRRVA